MMSHVEKKSSVGDAARSKVPLSHRLSLGNNLFVFTGWVMVLSSLLVGGAVGKEFRLVDAIPIIFFGTLANGIIGMMIASIGARTGYSAALIHRYVYGRKGVVLPNTIMAISGMGWAGLILNITRDGLLNVITPNGAEVLPFWVKLIVTIGIFSMFTLPAYMNIKWMAKVNWIAVPGYFLIFITVLILVLRNAGGIGALLAKDYGGGSSVFAGFDAAAGGWLVGCTFIANLARFWKNSRQAALGALFCFVFIVTFQYIGGAIGASHTGEYDIFKIASVLFAGTGFGVFAWLALYLGAQSTTQGSIYASGLAFSAPPIPMVRNQEYTRRLVTFIIAVIILVSSFLGVEKVVFWWSRFLACFIAPLSITVILDYWAFPNRRKLYEKVHGEDMDFNPAAYVAWVIGFIVGIYVSKAQIFSALLSAMIVSGAIYYTWMKIAVLRKTNPEKLLFQRRNQQGV